MSVGMLESESEGRRLSPRKNGDCCETPLTVLSLGSFDFLHADPSRMQRRRESATLGASPHAELLAGGGPGKISIVVDWPEELRQRLREKQRADSLFQN